MNLSGMSMFYVVRVNVSFAISSARRNRVSRERDVIEFFQRATFILRM